MASIPASEAPPPGPDFGPTLPALLSRRFGIRERVTALVAIAIIAVIGLTALVHSYATAPRHLVYRGGPTFNLQYARHGLKRVTPGPGELVRLEARRKRLQVSITVVPLHLPAYGGNVTAGLLPVYDAAYARTLRHSQPGFLQSDEGSARLNDVPGYQIGFRAGPPGHFTWGRDMLLVPQDVGVRDGVVLRLRQTVAGSVPKRDQHLLDTAHKAIKSFRFGTDPP
jgi:hypothetical protein